jgi:hypothetical protein
MVRAVAAIVVYLAGAAVAAAILFAGVWWLVVFWWTDAPPLPLVRVLVGLLIFLLTAGAAGVAIMAGTNMAARVGTGRRRGQ